MKITKSCLGLDCPERKSLCCGAYSTVSEGGGFICANCGKQFRGGECTAGENNPFSLSVPIPNGMELTNAEFIACDGLACNILKEFRNNHQIQ